MSQLVINHKLCDLCERCVQVCPFDALEIAEDRLQVSEECVLCGACVEACPLDIIEIEESDTAVQETDLDAFSGVWIVAEPSDRSENGFHPVALELIGKGRELADKLGEQLCVVVLGKDVDGQADVLKHYPVDRIFSLPDPSLQTFCSESWASVVADLIERHRPEIVLCGATSAGRSFLPRLAALLGTGLTADCTGLDVDDEEGTLLQTRPAFGGNIMATIVCPNHRPQMATVRPNVLPEAEAGERRNVEIVRTPPDPSSVQTPVEVLSDVVEETGAENIAEAEVIVAGGRGVGGPEGFEDIRRLAELLEGCVGASRAAVDAGWVPYAHQVGQTGVTVQPRLYVACGISGAVQHLVGMQSADTIIAINTDPGAPIFENADYGLVGDLHQLIPRLIDLISARKETADE